MRARNEKQLMTARIEEIAKLHNEILGNLKLCLNKAIRIGELLSEQKGVLPHGEFTGWIKGNLPFTDRTARNYMRLYRERDRLKTETVSDLTPAYRLLTSPKHGEWEKSVGESRWCYHNPDGTTVPVDFKTWVQGATMQELKFTMIEEKFWRERDIRTAEERERDKAEWKTVPRHISTIDKIDRLQRVLMIRTSGAYQGETCQGCVDWSWSPWSDKENECGLCELFLWIPCLPTDPACKFKKCLLENHKSQERRNNL